MQAAKQLFKLLQGKTQLVHCGKQHPTTTMNPQQILNAIVAKKKSTHTHEPTASAPQYDHCETCTNQKMVREQTLKLHLMEKVTGKQNWERN